MDFDIKVDTEMNTFRGGGVTGVLRLADIGLFWCGNAEIKNHFCGLRISVAFWRNADISAKLILLAKKSQRQICSFHQNIV